MTDERGRCGVCPTLTDPDALLRELRHHARELAWAPTPQSVRRLSVALDRFEPDTELQSIVRAAALTIVDGQQCHPELDEHHGDVCPCRAGGTPHELDPAETAEALAALVASARALYDTRNRFRLTPPPAGGPGASAA